MKILWINPAFLDYRVPVYEELNKLIDGQLKVVYSDTEKMTPARVADALKLVLHQNAIGLKGIKTYIIGNKDSNQSNSFANKFIKLNYQPNLLKVVRESDADVIIVEGFFQWSPAGYVKKVLQKKPIVLSYERTFHTERHAPKWREFYRKIIVKLFVDSAIVNGELSREYTHSLGLAKAKIITGGMAADSQFFRTNIKNLDKVSCRDVWDFKDEQLVFVCVGRLISRKGVMELLEAWKAFRGDALLVFAGEGELEDEISKFLHTHKISNVRLLGAIEYAKIPSLYLASDISLSSTLEDNWSLVVPEAMACGLPIACSKYNGCWPELVHDDVNGKVFDPLDSDNTLQTLEYFYNHRDRLDEMGKASKKIESEFTPKNAANAIFQACKIAIKG